MKEGSSGAVVVAEEWEEGEGPCGGSLLWLVYWPFAVADAVSWVDM